MLKFKKKKKKLQENGFPQKLIYVGMKTVFFAQCPYTAYQRKVPDKD